MGLGLLGCSQVLSHSFHCVFLPARPPFCELNCAELNRTRLFRAAQPAYDLCVIMQNMGCLWWKADLSLNVLCKSALMIIVELDSRWWLLCWSQRMGKCGGIFHVGVFVSYPQTSSTKSSHKFYPVKGEFSDENSDEGGFHKLGNPTFSRPQLVGAVATFHWHRPRNVGDLFLKICSQSIPFPCDSSRRIWLSGEINSCWRVL